METILAVPQPKRKGLDPSLSTRLDESTLQEFDDLALIYGVSKASLLRATVKDLISRHKGND
tara:strand:- start:577 stop:762 length:186 start_codon:yes stop_codon:yes gene_type:complete